MELSVILIPILIFVLLRGILDQRSRAHAERLAVLAEALKSGADRAAVEALAYQLTGRRPAAPVVPAGSRLQALLLALGWLTMFAGAGLWVLSQLLNSPEAGAAGALTALVGFGLVTYPFALRELEARRPAR